MPTFQYRALQSDGRVTEGQIEAGGRQEAFRQMEGRGLRPISLTEGRNGKAKKVEGNGKPRNAVPETADQPAKTFPWRKFSPGSPNRISGRMLENFTRLLSSLLAAARS